MAKTTKQKKPTLGKKKSAVKESELQFGLVVVVALLSVVFLGLAVVKFM